MELLGILFKINVSLLIFYLVYRWVLRKLTFYNFNRIYLLSGIIISALLPFLQGNAAVSTGISKMQQAVGMNPDDLFMSMKAYYFWDLGTIALFVYWSGVCLMSLIFLIQLMSLLLLFLRSRKERLFGYKVRILQEQSQPFSFFRGIFIHPARHSAEEILSILQHEEIHVHQWHSVDVLLGEIKRILCWFNPAAWLVLSAIRENLEFIADRKVLQNGMDAKVYQYTLLSVQQSASQQLITNNFNFSHLKLRITMMNKRKSSDLHLMKYLLAVPVIAMAGMLTNYANAQIEQDKETSRATITINGITTFDLEELENLSDEALEKKLGMKKEGIKTVEIRKGEPGTTSMQYGGNDHREPEYRIDDNVSEEDMKKKSVAVKMQGNGLRIVTMETRPGVTADGRGERVQVDQTAGFTTAGIKLYDGKKVTDENVQPIFYVNGKKVEKIEDLDPEHVLSVTVLKDASAKAYDPNVKDGHGIILIETKNDNAKSSGKSMLQQDLNSFRLYPNPANDILNLDIYSDHIDNTYEIFDAQGKKVLSGKLKSKNTIHTAHLRTGTYIIRMMINGQPGSMKFEVVR